jgi:hypothetical protein
MNRPTCKLCGCNLRHPDDKPTREAGLNSKKVWQEELFEFPPPIQCVWGYVICKECQPELNKVPAKMSKNELALNRFHKKVVSDPHFARKHKIRWSIKFLFDENSPAEPIKGNSWVKAKIKARNRIRRDYV